MLVSQQSCWSEPYSAGPSLHVQLFHIQIHREMFGPTVYKCTEPVRQKGAHLVLMPVSHCTSAKPLGKSSGGQFVDILLEYGTFTDQF